MSKTAIIIPARLGSIRLPCKMLLADTGKPLIQHTYEAARATGHDVFVATDSHDIARCVAGFGGTVIMTGPCESGTARVFRAASQLPYGYDKIVNLQGDEPDIEPVHIQTAIDRLRGGNEHSVATLAAPAGIDVGMDPNVVKVVLRHDGTALCFSRSAIPNGASAYLRHIGIYVFWDAAIRMRGFVLPTRRVEAVEAMGSENLEQLYWLYDGTPILVAVVSAAPSGIDTRADYDSFVRRCASR